MDVIETDLNVLLYSLENNDVVLLTSVGSIPLLRLLESKFEESILFVCDNTRLEFLSGYKIQDDLNADLPLESGVCWMSYDLLWFHLVSDLRFLEKFKLVVFDGMDERTLISDLTLSLIVNLKVEMQNCLILLKSRILVDIFSEFINKSFKYKLLNFASQKSSELVLYFGDSSSDIHKGIVDTINTIFTTDTSIYDILILLPDYYDLEFLKVYSINTGNYSIVNKIEDYSAKENQTSRRLIFSDTACAFINLQRHGVKYVIDSGEIKILRADVVNPSINQLVTKNSNLNAINVNIGSIIPNSKRNGMKYFVLKEKSLLENGEYGIQNGEKLILYILGLFKILNAEYLDIANFLFLTKPHESLLRNCINQLIYLGLLQVQSGFKGVQLTERGNMLLKFHFTKSSENFSFFISLIHNGPQVLDLLQLISVYNVLNLNSIRKYLKATKSERDFEQIIELFKQFERNDASLNVHFATPNLLKKRIINYYKNLKRVHDKSVGQPMTYTKYQTLIESLIFGFQFNLCVVEDTEVQPILSAPDFGRMQLKDNYYEEGDILLASKITSCDAANDSNIAFTCKVPKKVLFDMKLPLFKFQ
jgi:hypothetical protein